MFIEFVVKNRHLFVKSHKIGEMSSSDNNCLKISTDSKTKTFVRSSTTSEKTNKLEKSKEKVDNN